MAGSNAAEHAPIYPAGTVAKVVCLSTYNAGYIIGDVLTLIFFSSRRTFSTKPFITSSMT